MLTVFGASLDPDLIPFGAAGNEARGENLRHGLVILDGESKTRRVVVCAAEEGGNSAPSLLCCLLCLMAHYLVDA